MVLVPQVVDAVGPDVPVLAAGGIADGRQMAAAMALGAQGAWTGSIWLTDRGGRHRTRGHREPAGRHRPATSSAPGSMTGKPARQLRTAWTEAWEQPGAPDPLPMPLQGLLYGEAASQLQPRAFQGIRWQPGRADPRQRRPGATGTRQSCSTWSRGGSARSRGCARSPTASELPVRATRFRGGRQPCRGRRAGQRRLRMHGQRDGRSWWLGEVEVVDEVAEDRRVLAHVGSRVRAAVGRGIEPLTAEEVVLDELVVRVEAQRLVVDVALLARTG